jgi:hypothetical protein
MNLLSRQWPRIAGLTVLATLACASTGLREVTLRVSSPFYPDRHEDHVVKPGERFPVMDLDLSGTVADFVADFAIDTTGMKVTSRSDTLNNPAVKVGIYRGDSLVDHAWAFRLGQFKHVSRRSALIFEIVNYSAGKPYLKPRATAAKGDGPKATEKSR